METLTANSINIQYREFSPISEDYADLLKILNIPFELTDPFLQVGLISKTQGWILHLSITISQINDLFEKVVPLLWEENVAFRIPADKDFAKSILNGNLGMNQLGKIITIYPEDDNCAMELARKLIDLTKSFEGPMIPTDILLGGVVYTRYGGFNPVIKEDTYTGKKENYIYDDLGQLIKDPYLIPFKLPKNVIWPFGEIVSSESPARIDKVLNGIYKPLFFLKSDTKGDVYLGLYLKRFWQARKCVIKQGKKNALSEENGRTIRDRLVWQYRIYNKLKGLIPMAGILDLFDENGDTYLVMEYIKGRSLFDQIKRNTFDSRCWVASPIHTKKTLLQFLLQVISHIDVLHQMGFVHRDIAPGNFLIGKTGQIFLIDLELAYSLTEKQPAPPFEQGTTGFMSPQQQVGMPPETKDDIYSLGALLLITFTGLSPVKFFGQSGNALESHLSSFINSPEIARLISACLSIDPALRPSIDDIRQILQVSLQENNSRDWESAKTTVNLDMQRITYSISQALTGLTNPPIVINDDYWYSKYPTNESPGAHTQKEYIRYPGLYEGIGGVLYLLARAKKAGFDIHSSTKSYRKGLEFIQENVINLLPNTAPGLYHGAAGVALSLAEGISARVLPDNSKYQEHIKNCLDLPISDITLASGLAGQGLAILQCASFLDETYVKNKLDLIAASLLEKQGKNGSWLIGDTHKASILSFGYGMPGIIYFLLQYYSQNRDESLKEKTIKALNYLLKSTNNLRDLFEQSRFNKQVAKGREKGDERKGIILTFIKAFEVLKDPTYYKRAEEALLCYPELIVKNDFSQDAGLAGLGELYLEAFRVFKDIKWKWRAEWIAQIFTCTFCELGTGTGFWMTEERNEPTADFMTGNSGIIHFLLRLRNPTSLGYRLLE